MQSESTSQAFTFSRFQDKGDEPAFPFVIAEIGHNHQGDVGKAEDLIRAAAACGASAAKFQKRSNRDLFTKSGYDAPYSSENAFAPTYGQHREALEFGREEYLRCRDAAEDAEILFFATAFDKPSVDFLVDLDVPLFKVASGDLRSLPLLEHIAQTGRPTIISTGGGTLEDVRVAYEIFEQRGTELSILQCTAGYPPAYEELNLRVIETFQREFPRTLIGYSGHDNGIAMPLVAYMLGARIIEKHFTLDRSLKGTDHSFSLEPTGMRKMIRDIKRARLALGDGNKTVYESEKAPVEKMSKSIVAARKLSAGTQLEEDDLAFKSPGVGMKPNRIHEIIGKVLLTDLEEDELFAPEKVQ